MEVKSPVPPGAPPRLAMVLALEVEINILSAENLK